jgi:hypothetical protein
MRDLLLRLALCLFAASIACSSGNRASVSDASTLTIDYGFSRWRGGTTRAGAGNMSDSPSAGSSHPIGDR